MVAEQLHDEGGDAAVDANEDVDAGQDHVGRAGDLEEEGGRVHEGRDGPAGEQTQTVGTRTRSNTTTRTGSSGFKLEQIFPSSAAFGLFIFPSFISLTFSLFLGVHFTETN